MVSLVSLWSAIMIGTKENNLTPDSLQRQKIKFPHKYWRWLYKIQVRSKRLTIHNCTFTPCVLGINEFQSPITAIYFWIPIYNLSNKREIKRLGTFLDTFSLAFKPITGLWFGIDSALNLSMVGEKQIEVSNYLVTDSDLSYNHLSSNSFFQRKIHIF